MAVFALGSSAFSALSAFLAALPFPALPLAGFELPEPTVDRAPLRAVDAPAFAPVVLEAAALGVLALAGADLAADRWVLRDDVAFDPVALDAVALDAVAVVLAGAAASDLAASLSDMTAVSSALVADEMAVSALISVFADVTAWVAAAFSFVEAEVTFVAAVETVRVVPLAPVVLLPLVREAAVREPADLVELEVFVAPGVFAALAAFVVRARDEFAIRTGAALAVAFLVGGTDLLPPIWISYRGGHSTESNLLHI